MADRFLKEVDSDNFNPKQFVHELSLKSDQGATDLLCARQKVQVLADEISGQLKRNVYNNYTQFIDTAKEISYLESEMYQLSHLLTEQKELMTVLLESSVLGTKLESNTGNGASPKKLDDQQREPDEEVEPKKALTTLLEKVEGCASIMDVPGRFVVFNGDLVELDPNTFSRAAQIRAFLLNDGIVFATWVQNRRGPVRYKFQVLYELDSLPVVNVRDIPEVKNAFKIMLFPEARLFVCDSPKTKKEWLEHIETTKKAKRNAENVRRETHLEAAAVAAAQSTSQTKPEPPGDKNNPFNDDDEKEEKDLYVEESADVASIFTELLPGWLLELPEDLDVCIAQRDFDEATNLIDKANLYIRQHSVNGVPHLNEMRHRIESRVKMLTEELQNELRVSPDKSLQGGPRAARRAVFLLVKLGKSSQACDLFLRHHSAIIRHSVRQLKLEGETRPYVRRLCSVFFTNVADTCRSLEQAVPLDPQQSPSSSSLCTSPSAASAFIVWARSELATFVAIFSRQVFAPHTFSSSSASLVAECVSVARQHCDQLAESAGLDLTFQLNSMLQLHIERIIIETRDKMLEAIKLRAAEDKWRPLNLQNKLGLDKFLDEMSEIGITNIRSYVNDECWIELSANTVQFTKAYLNLVEDVLLLHTADIHHQVDTTLHDIFRAQLKHVELSSKSNKHKATEVSFILKNGAFLLTDLLPLAERRYQQQLGHSCPLLTKLHNDNTDWLEVTVGSTTKYSSTGFI